MPREVVKPTEIEKYTNVRATQYPSEKVKKLNGNIAVPSYVHGYSLAIEFMYNWFASKFDKDYFKGGIYVDGKHVLDDYKQFSKNVIKGQNPRARIEPRVQYDYDRETQDLYLAPPDLYLRKSKYNESFFKDYDRDMFLGIDMRALRMDFNFKVRVDTRSQQLDLFNRMQLYFRIGSTMKETISVDFHVPKEIMLNIAERAGFQIVNNEVVDIISFLNYVNAHSELPFFFKIRAINQKPEFFIRMNGLYTHINCTDKLSLDDGERDGKLDLNFQVEMNATLTIPIPHFYSFYSATELTTAIRYKEPSDNTVAIYSINLIDIPNQDENGWARAAITDYSCDKGEEYMDLAPIFTGDNVLARTINHDLTKGVSPKHFINIKVYRNEDVARNVDIYMNYENMRCYLKNPPDQDEIYHIAVYYDRNYINQLDIELNKYNDNRLDVLPEQNSIYV